MYANRLERRAPVLGGRVAICRKSRMSRRNSDNLHDATFASEWKRIYAENQPLKAANIGRSVLRRRMKPNSRSLFRALCVHWAREGEIYSTLVLISSAFVSKSTFVPVKSVRHHPSCPIDFPICGGLSTRKCPASHVFRRSIFNSDCHG